MNNTDKEHSGITRQEFLAHVGRGAALLALGGTVGTILTRKARGGQVWQIDPTKCTQCGQCATYCVLDQSAVRCFHTFAMCGYCNLCTGFFEPDANALNEGAENQICPTGAIQRRFVIDPYFEYQIDEPKCIGCARCVKGCTQFGNSSLYLQVRHDVCVNCNQCNIAANCPSNAFIRLPANDPYFHRLGPRA
ncbi:MAG: 4Fe-4S binding protein [Candidatus Sumerlaeota bacterium]|nr:4Fe-4S binding protein [Candidatus Sumerlaeota bacterium]